MPQAYLTKAAASKRSGRSVRRLLELAAAGRIRKKIVTDSKNNNRELCLFDANDIAMLASGDLPPVPVIDGQKRMLALAGPVSQPAAMLPPAPVLRRWMTLDEAAGYSGLPASILKALIERGKLLALDVGPRPGGRWRVSKTDIDGIRGTTHRG